MVRSLSEDLWGRAAEVEVGAGEITATVTAGAGEYLFLNFVASKGYTVTVNGREAELIDNDLHFLLVAVDEGENVVRFTYSSPYVRYAAAGLAGAVVGLLAVALVVKKTKFMQKASSVIAWAGVSLALAGRAVFHGISAFCIFGKSAGGGGDEVGDPLIFRFPPRPVDLSRCFRKKSKKISKAPEKCLTKIVRVSIIGYALPKKFCGRACTEA